MGSGLVLALLFVWKSELPTLAGGHRPVSLLRHVSLEGRWFRASPAARSSAGWPDSTTACGESAVRLTSMRWCIRSLVYLAQVSLPECGYDQLRGWARHVFGANLGTTRRWLIALVGLKDLAT